MTKTLMAGFLLGIAATVVACMVWAYREQQGREAEEWPPLWWGGRGS